MSPQPTFESDIQHRLAEIRTRVADAATLAGRNPDGVKIVAVSKNHPPSAVTAAVACGQFVFGENRVQEAQGKFADLQTSRAHLRLHLIGPLQTNKARDAVRIADVIETLDRPRLSNAIEDAAAREGRLPDLLIQVNVGDEPQKAGVATSAADAFIQSSQTRFGAKLVGLMCIPPSSGDPAPHFLWLAVCARRHGLSHLSMGMSMDFEQAIQHGATHVRIGSAIFGSR